jgi:hypothetical protein
VPSSKLFIASSLVSINLLQTLMFHAHPAQPSPARCPVFAAHRLPGSSSASCGLNDLEQTSGLRVAWLRLSTWKVSGTPSFNFVSSGDSTRFLKLSAMSGFLFLLANIRSLRRFPLQCSRHRRIAVRVSAP